MSVLGATLFREHRQGSNGSNIMNQMQIISGLWELLLLAAIIGSVALIAYAKGFREGRSEGYHRGRSVGMQIGAKNK